MSSTLLWHITTTKHSFLCLQNSIPMSIEYQHVLSHGTTLSAGVAILFSPRLNVDILQQVEIEEGRALVVKAEVQGFTFTFINVYAPNTGSDRGTFFRTLENKLDAIDQRECVVLGGDWNCCIDFTLDRTGEEPHFQSSSILAQVIQVADVVDVWRMKHPSLRQYTWVRVLDGRVSAARLDRFYVSTSFVNRVSGCQILPAAFTDHHIVLFDFLLSPNAKSHSFWHFNVKLLDDFSFCNSFKLFWAYWRTKKQEFPSLTHWWEVGKAKIRVFCQQFKLDPQ